MCALVCFCVCAHCVCYVNYVRAACTVCTLTPPALPQSHFYLLSLLSLLLFERLPSEYDPASQGIIVSWWVSGQAYPAGQEAQEDSPAREYVPLGHAFSTA